MDAALASRRRLEGAFMRLLTTAFVAIGLVIGCQQHDMPIVTQVNGRGTDNVQLARAKQIPAETVGQIEPVALFRGPMPTGVTVSQDGRIFVNFPRWGDPVEYTVAEIVNGQAIPYPNLAFNKLHSDKPSDCLVSVQSVVVDQKNRLWVLDTGSINFQPPLPRGPKLICYDLQTNEEIKRIEFPNTALSTTYLNDVRFNLNRQPRFHEGKDLRQQPYVLFRTRINSEPVAIR
jgi:hypothetical protein